MTLLVGNPLSMMNSATGFPVALPVNVVRVVARAIKFAWEEIQKAPCKHLVPKGPAVPEEDMYSDALCNLLDQMLKADEPVVDGFSSALFDTICRGESLPNCSGESLNKSPDIVIRLANSPLSGARRLVGIFIESKIVTMSKPITKYTSDGLSRFVVGDYGWAMQAGMMLAYQKEKCRDLFHLERQLSSEPGLLSKPMKGGYLDFRPEYTPITCASHHEREWMYLNGDKPGPILIWHMWDLKTPY